jgi:TolB-like protein
MKPFQIVSLLIFSMSLTSYCFGQDAKDAGSLAIFSVKSGKRLESIAGVFLKSEKNKIHVFDLKTFSERSFDSKNVLSKKVPASESEVASRRGVAPIVAWKIKDLIPEPPKPGKVAAVDGAVAYVSIGEGGGIRKGSELDVFRGEEVIKDPVSGEVLGRKRRKIAKVEVLEVRDKLSKVKLLGELELKLEVGDVVESDRTSRSIAVLPATNTSGAILKSGVALADEITSAFSKFKVSIVERTKLTDVIGELALQRTGFFDNKTVQKLGNQVGAYAVLSGTIIPSGKKSKVSVRLVEVETGKVLYATAVEVKPLSAEESDLKELGISMSKKIIASQSDSVWKPCIFYVDEKGGTIYRANLNGSNAIQIVKGLRMPRGIAIDPLEKKIYWVDAAAYKIQRSNFDGSKIESLNVKNLATIGPITIDAEQRRIYWLNTINAGNKRSIHSANLDGSNQAVFIEHGTGGMSIIGKPFYETNSGMFYWLGSLQDGFAWILRMDRDGTSFRKIGRLMPAKQAGISDIAIDFASKKIYWTNSRQNKIQRAGLDGSKVEDVITGLGREPEFLALDQGVKKIYWGEVHGKIFARANFDGSDRETLKSGLRLPRGIAIFNPSSE